MAKLTLTADQETTAKSWLYDIFWLSGRRSRSKPAKRTNYYWTAYYSNFDESKAEVITNALLKHNLDYKQFMALDDAIAYAAQFSFAKSFDKADGGVRKFANILTGYFVWFCIANRIYWDNTLLSQPEMTEIIRDSKTAKSLWDNECFVSQESPQEQPTPDINATHQEQPTPHINAADADAGGTAKKQPVNGYKSAGKLSDKVPTLVGKPGDKITFTPNSYIYFIVADGPSKNKPKNKPNLYVTPISQSATAVSADSAKAVKLGSGNGYSDCRLFWENKNDAIEFLNRCKSKFANSSKFDNLRVEFATADGNGYFQVETEFGNAYIKAVKLNEEHEEELQEDATELDKRNEYGDKIRDIDVYSRYFDKYGD